VLRRLRRLLWSRLGLVLMLWLAAIIGLHLGQRRHDQLPLDLAGLFPVGEPVPQGAVLGTTLATIVHHELNDGFGWRPNDFFLWSPRWWADNNANRQLGIIAAVRVTLAVMMDDLTKAASDPVDENLGHADTAFQADAERFMSPSAESRYTEGVDALASYVRGLGPALGTSKPFTAQHDGLPHIAAAWAELLGKAHVDLYRDDLRPRPLRPWEADDVFYRAQGYAHVLGYCTLALEREYEQRLTKDPGLAALLKHAELTLRQAALMKPFVVLDGGPEGLIANHRRTLDAMLADARQTLEAIRDKLAQ
jgi:hypothetical protein